MSEATATAEPTAVLLPGDILAGWQLRIASRADELAQLYRRERARDRDIWLQAEREILGVEPPPDTPPR